MQHASDEQLHLCVSTLRYVVFRRCDVQPTHPARLAAIEAALRPYSTAVPGLTSMQALGTDLALTAIATEKLVKDPDALRFSASKSTLTSKQHAGKGTPVRCCNRRVTCARGDESCKTTQPRFFHYIALITDIIIFMSCTEPESSSVQGWTSDGCDGFVECVARAVLICSE
jgi:hypothetical protein